MLVMAMRLKMTWLTAFILFIVALSDGFLFCNGLLYELVTCGSVIKLQNASFKARLHSHEVQYGSGSGQQSVTGIQDTDDVNSHWIIKGVMEKSCNRGEPVRCGETIRLEHVMTGRNLHSHLFPAPLSRGQEVSAFGKNGIGDTGDYWTVLCDDDHWHRDDEILLKHQDTNMYLGISGTTFGHPIPGQLEVYAISRQDSASYWKVNEGVFIKQNLETNTHETFAHTEL